MMTNSTPSSASGSRTTTDGSNSMPTDTKNSTANASCSGSEFSAGLVAQLRLGEHHAGEERAERERHVEQRRGAVGDAERDREHGQREQLARAGARDLMQQPGHDARADDQHQRDEHRDLQRGDQPDAPAQVQRRRASRRRACRPRAPAGTPARAPSRGPRRSASRPRCWPFSVSQLVALLERAQQHDGARDRQRQAEHQPGAETPAHQRAPCRRRSRWPRRSARRRRAARCARTDIRSSIEKCRPDAEHQQDHADFGELGGEARRRRRSPA